MTDVDQGPGVLKTTDDTINRKDNFARSTVSPDQYGTSEYRPVPVAVVRRLVNNGEDFTIPDDVDSKTLLDWANRIVDETDGTATVVFTGILPDSISPDHLPISVDGLLAVPGNGDQFSTELPLDFLQAFRMADEVVAVSDLMRAWWTDLA